MAGVQDSEYLEYVAAHRGRMLRTARLLTSGDAYWADELPHLMAGSRQAIVASGSGTQRGNHDVHMRMSSTKLIQVISGPGLGWDLPTLLRFTGSCGYAK